MIIIDVKQDNMGNVLLTPRSRRIQAQMRRHNKEWTGNASDDVFLQEWRGDEFLDSKLTSTKAQEVRSGYTVGVKMDPWEFGHYVGHDFHEVVRPNPGPVERGAVLGSFGDVNPLDHGGGMIYESGQGPAILYTPGLSDEDPDDDDVENVVLEVYEVQVEDDVVKDLNWVTWGDVARSIGMPVSELKQLARDPSVMARASAIDAVAGYYGWHELDQYPLKKTYGELDEEWFPGGDRAESL